MAVSRVFLYASNLVAWQRTVAATRAFSFLRSSASALVTLRTAVSRSPCWLSHAWVLSMTSFLSLARVLVGVVLSTRS